MANSVVELLFKFITSGGADIDKAASGVEKLTTGATKGSAPIDALGKSLGRAKKEAEGTSKSLEGLADKIRDGLSNPLQTAGGAVEGFVGKLGKVGIVAGGVAVGIGLIAKQAFDLVSAMGKAAEETVNLADRLDISSGAAERLQAMAKISSVNIGSLEGASRTLSAVLEDSSGQGAKAAAALQKLGVNTVTAAGQMREPGPILLDMLDKLSQVGSTSERVFLAQQVLPRAAAKELIPLIKNYRELQEAVGAIGIGLDENLTQNLAKADDEIDKLELSWERLKKSFAGKIAPIVVPVVVKVTEALNGKLPKGVDGSFGGSLQTVNTQAEANTLDVGGAVTGFVDKSLRSASETAKKLMAASIEAGSVQAAAFRESQKITEAGVKAELAKVNSDLAKVTAIAGADGLTSTAQASAQAQANALNAKRLDLEKKIEGFARKGSEKASGDLKLSDLLAKSGNSKPGIPPSLRGAFGALGTFQAEGFDSGEDVGANGLFNSTVGPARSKGDPLAENAFAEELLKNLQMRLDLTAKRTEMDLAAAVRLAELGDNEYDAAALVRDIKLSTAKTVLESRQAELDYTVKIAEIDKARLDKYKDTAAQVFRSIRQRGGGGLRDLITGQADIQGEKIFANVSGALFQKAGSTLGRIGAAIPGGEKIFEGTIFDPKNQKPLDKNTIAVETLTKSVDKLRVGINGGAGGPGGSSGLSGILGSVPGGSTLADFASDLGGITGGKSGGGDPIFGKLFGGKSSAAGGFFGGIGSVPGGLFKGLGGDFSIRTGDGSATTAGTAGRIGNVAGSAVAIAAGVKGVLDGIKEGGARGAVGGIGSVLGVASLIPGPQQPFIMTAAIVANLVKGLIPSGKETFDRDQNNVLAGRKFTAPESMDRAYDFSTGGDSVDADYRGRTRVFISKPVTVQVSAMDARSFIDRRDDIADAVGSAMDKGHPVGVSVQKVIFGQGG